MEIRLGRTACQGRQYASWSSTASSHCIMYEFRNYSICSGSSQKIRPGNAGLISNGLHKCSCCVTTTCRRSGFACVTGINGSLKQQKSVTRVHRNGENQSQRACVHAELDIATADVTGSKENAGIL